MDGDATLAERERHPAGADPELERSAVAGELGEEVDGGVQFTLTAEGVPVGTKTAKQMEGGATFIVKTLKAIVEDGRPPLGTRVLFKVFKLMAPFSPKTTLTENWPLPEV